MKIEKNKIVFAAVLVCVVLFIAGYAIMVLGDDEEPTMDSNQIPLPELDESLQEYDSKMEALEALKEARETNAPSVYDESLMDSTGVFDPMLEEKDKMHIIDSIYAESQITYGERKFSPPEEKPLPDPEPEQIAEDTLIVEKEKDVEAKAIALAQQLFFASHPIENDNPIYQKTDDFIFVRVDGTQIVKKDFRLQMRLTEEAQIRNVVYPRNTLLYGFINFKPNRTIITIENINHNPVKLRSFDLQDGSEGINVQNTFQAEVGQEVIGDMVDDINIVGMPQVSGFKKIFQRNNRRIKATIYDNYRLILKTVPIK